MMGGIFSKMLINKPLALYTQLIISAVMVIATSYKENIEILIGFTIMIHLIAGLVFNNIYAHCLQRFTSNAGVANGLTGGGIYVISSAIGYSLIGFFDIKTAGILASINLLLVLILLLALIIFKKFAWPANVPS